MRIRRGMGPGSWRHAEASGKSYCLGLIAQLTFTVTDSVSSPGATGAAGAAIGAAAILP